MTKVDQPMDYAVNAAVEAFQRSYRLGLPCERYEDAAPEYGDLVHGYCANCAWTWDSHDTSIGD